MPSPIDDAPEARQRLGPGAREAVVLFGEGEHHDAADEQGRGHICVAQQDCNTVVQCTRPFRGVVAGGEQCAGDAVAQELCVQVVPREKGAGNSEAVRVGDNVCSSLPDNAVDRGAC